MIAAEAIADGNSNDDEDELIEVIEVAKANLIVTHGKEHCLIQQIDKMAEKCRQRC